jgi:orotidine-5'-phosphate decarboxylase
VTNPLIAALDVPTRDAALRLSDQLTGLVGAFKIGSELFTSAGPEIVRHLRSAGAQVFLDLKFHDIPNTVAGAVASALELDVQMFTVHATGGGEMLKAAERAAQEGAGKRGRTPPLVLGVTVLTSMDANALEGVGVQGGPAKQVERLAAMAIKCGLRGLVCSPLEITALRQILPRKTCLVTPGIRPADSAPDDQKRTLTPREAIDAGADWLVIGRPIYAAPDPAAAARKILDSLP